MPKALATDYSFAKALYLKGVNLPAIAKQLGLKVGTLRQRKTREGWAREKEAQNTTLEPAQTAVPTSLAERINQDVVNEAGELIKALVSMGRPRTLGDVKVKAQALLTAYSTARKGLNMDGTGAGSVHLHLHTMLKPDSLPQSPILDVETQSI